MKEPIVPNYLPAAAFTFTPKDGGEPVTVYRPYEAMPFDELEKHAAENERVLKGIPALCHEARHAL